jgi:hypothetical protein
MVDMSISRFGDDQSNLLFRLYVLQKLCPGKFLLKAPWVYDELDDDAVCELKQSLTELMPLDTMVTDMWDWEIHFENITFEDSFFDIAFGTEPVAMEESGCLPQDILGWIDQFDMDYSYMELEQDQFEKWVEDECVRFISKWRSNIVEQFTKPEKDKG